MQWRILIVDDEPNVCEALARALRREPYEVLTARSSVEALKILRREPVDVIVSDEEMPGMSGSEFLSVARREWPDTVRMMLTGRATLETALRAINEGQVYHFFLKPCSDVEIATTIRHALQQKEILAESRRLLRVTQHQSALIQKLEDAYPGITRVDRTASGAVILHEAHESLEALVKQMREVSLEAEHLMQ